MTEITTKELKETQQYLNVRSRMRVFFFSNKLSTDKFPTLLEMEQKLIEITNDNDVYTYPITRWHTAWKRSQ
jgi:hypothetical protein